jgi:hypothetical protein
MKKKMKNWGKIESIGLPVKGEEDVAIHGVS